MKNLISQLLAKQAVSENELAEKISVDIEQIKAFCNGEYQPNIFVALKISKIFRKEVEEIFIMEELDLYVEERVGENKK